ncbi:MAG TPA: 5-formyltetrahydrofolate cyclo-ligase [Phycisphaerales bacterium]|nr:5-formyltetrahydrofolate cyclo-ligase [Phycisphaerales bacterium]HMP38528.1 5-formyltetrahydrofolate cyclo-ligase [Phycisphaerales bacterium]
MSAAAGRQPDKPELRRRIVEALRALGEDARARGSAAIVARLVGLGFGGAPAGDAAGPRAVPLPGEAADAPRLADGVLMAFLPLRLEVDLTELLRLRIASGGRVAVPRVVEMSDRIEPVELTSVEPASLDSDRFGVPTPRGAVPVSTEALGAVLVPGLAFDDEGRRLGRGGGHYDRFLARLPRTVRRIGICFGLQRVERVPEERHDRRVECVVTEEGITYSRTPRGPQGPPQ